MSTSTTLHSIQEKIKKSLYEKNFITNLLEIIENKTKVNRLYILYGIVGFLTLYLTVGWGNDFLCNFIGFLYPAYASVKAIETTSKEDDTKWLMYWSVYALFGLLEYFGDQLLFWIPFYSLSKCVFLLWLMVPGKNGGTYIIYNRLLKPFVLKHQGTIDSGIDQAKDVVNKFTSQSKNE